MSSLKPLGNFRRNPSKLELTASVVSAAVLCRQEVIALPRAIQQKIERFMPIVKEQIASWSNFYRRQILFGQHRPHEYFHVLVWSADGTINDEDTAREMLKQDGLNAATKYRIACNHCLENEIRALWPNLKTKVNLEKAERLFPLVYYWECVCRNGKTTELTEYIVEKVFNNKYSYNYPTCATDYFFNRSYWVYSIEEIDFLAERYLPKIPFRSWENFLMKLTYNELMLLFCFGNLYAILNDIDILTYLTRFWMHADFVVQVWMRIRDRYWTFTFVCAIREFFTCRVFDIHSTEHISLAVEIFNLAPYNLQKAVHLHYLTRKWWNRDLNLTDVRLDVAILSTIDPNYRRHSFWALQWIDVFKKYPTDCFVQLMDVCCEEEGSEEFKIEVMEMNDDKASEYCYTLLREMRLAELVNFLGMFSSDTGTIMKTKQIILRKNLIERADRFEKDDAIFPPPSQLVDFIEGSFENIRSANEFKIDVLSSVNCLKACYKVAGNDMFSWLKDAVWMCSCNGDDFKQYKSKFLQLGVELAKAKSSEIPDFFKDPGWKSFLNDGVRTRIRKCRRLR